MDYGIIAFWLFLTVTAICITWVTHLGRLASEATIRQAIERGVVTDAEAIHRLRGQVGMAWHVKLKLFGILFAFLGLALGVLGGILYFMEPDTLLPMLGAGGFGIIFGTGLFVTGAYLRRMESEQSR